MIISHKHRYVFIEVPHTASSAIAVELCDHHGGEPILHKHANYSQFHARATPEERTYFVFGCVRNPLDSAVTVYFKYKTNHLGVYTNPDHWVRNGGWVQDTQLERYAFIADDNASFAQFFARYYTAIYHNWMLMGQFGHVMRYEHITEEFPRILKKLGIESVRELPRWNPTSRKAAFEQYYVPEIRDQAVRTMGPFMEKWGYDFPNEWEPARIPLINRLRFSLVEGAINLAAPRMQLDPGNALLQSIKAIMNPVSGAGIRKT